MDKRKPIVFAVSGYKNSGKTTLTVKLVEELTARGFRVATVKHDGHDFEPDVPGTDSYRHRMAGACATAVFSDHKWMMVQVQPEKEEEKIREQDLMNLFPEVDVILLEGFKHSDYPKYFCRYPESIPDVKEALSMVLTLLN